MPTFACQQLSGILRKTTRLRPYDDYENYELFDCGRDSSGTVPFRQGDLQTELPDHLNDLNGPPDFPPFGGPASPAAATIATGVATRPRRWWLPLVAVGALAAVAGAGAWALLSRPTPATAPPTRRFTITLPEGEILPASVGTVVSIAPDGRTILYRTERGGVRQLFRRSLDQFDSSVVSGIADLTVNQALMSPDGRWIVYESQRTLKKIPSAGGPAQTLTSLPAVAGARSWTPTGTWSSQ